MTRGGVIVGMAVLVFAGAVSMSDIATKKIPIIGIRAVPLEDLRYARVNGACPASKCDGSKSENVLGDCVCLTSETDPLTGEIEDVGDLPEGERLRLIGCCDSFDNETTRWQPVTDSVPSECIQLAPPSLVSNISMRGFDLGEVDVLDTACCLPNESMVLPGDWGQCPFCAFKCNPAHKAIPDPSGCNEWCE